MFEAFERRALVDDRPNPWERRALWFAFGLVVGIVLSALWFKAQIDSIADTSRQWRQGSDPADRR